MSESKHWAYYVFWIPVKFVLLVAVVSAVAAGCMGLTMVLWNDIGPKMMAGESLGPIGAAKLFLLAWFLVALPSYLVINAGSRRLNLPERIARVKDVVIGKKKTNEDGTPAKADPNVIAVPELKMPQLQMPKTTQPRSSSDNGNGENTPAAPAETAPPKRSVKMPLGR